MRIRFVERTNPDIDRLVEISWEARASHEDELFRIPERDEEEATQLINDEVESEPYGEKTEELPEEDEPYIDLSKFSDAKPFEGEASTRPPVRRLLVTVDSGIAHLGEFVGGGIAFAIRGAAGCLIEDEGIVLRYNTGSLLVDEKNRVPLFSYIGKRLGNEELYLTRLESGDLAPNPAVLANVNQIQDRYRNFVERMIQEEALAILVSNGRGLFLLDGALPAGTYDTPVSYMQRMLEVAADKKIDVMAVSKKSRISVAGKPISALFDDWPTFVGYMPLKETLAREREKYVQEGLARRVSEITLANELFAVRFGLGPPALTFRVDVHNSIRSTPTEVLNYTVNQCQIHGCYPKPLIDAHQFSSFVYQDVQLLTADLVARTGARPKEDSSMSWMFEPFGGFGK